MKLTRADKRRFLKQFRKQFKKNLKAKENGSKGTTDR